MQGLILEIELSGQMHLESKDLCPHSHMAHYPLAPTGNHIFNVLTEYSI